jgi:pyridoxamine 5'-phosphate oxidase
VTPSTGPRPLAAPDIARMRREYADTTQRQAIDTDAGLAEADLAPDWPTQFGRWFADAVAAGLPEPNAMVVATADAQGRPSARHVLLKGYDERGFTFFTNYGSRKAVEALANPYASLVFPWFAIYRQVVVCGWVERVDRDETEAYFAQRPRGAQIGAWASPQSQVIRDRAALEAAFAEVERRFPDDTPVPPPPHWGGLRVVPDSVEFWHGRISRLHDRLRYRRTPEGWTIERLAP